MIDYPIFYMPEHFGLYELVPKGIYDMRQEKSWELLDPRILITADTLRREYGRMVINTWRWGGRSQDRGFRAPDSGIGAFLSQHKHGRALDGLFPDFKPGVEQIRRDILNSPEKFPFITCIEMDVDWLHVDCRNHGEGGIKLVYP